MKLLFGMNNIIKKYQILILSVVYYIYLEGGGKSMKYKGGECGGETWRGDREGMKDITIS